LRLAWLDDLFGKVHIADRQLNFSKKITDIRTNRPRLAYEIAFYFYEGKKNALTPIIHV
jgi:hypothetical protein